MFLGTFAAGVVDEDAAHGGRRCREEVTAVIEDEACVGLAHQPQVGFVNQTGGVERLARFFLGHLPSSEPAQFVVDQRQKLLNRPRVAGGDLRQDVGDVGHLAG